MGGEKMIAEQYLDATKMLNYHSSTISSLVKTSGWDNLDTFGKIGAIYNFVQNEILFGYNISDNL